MTKKAKGNFKFGVLDAVVLILVIALVVTVIFRFTTDMRLFTYDSEKYVVTVRASGLQYTTAGMLNESDSVYFENGDYLGTFTSSPTVTPKMAYEFASDGEIVPAYYPDNTLIDITNNIECELITSNGMLVTKNGTHLAVGVVLEIHTQTVDLTVEIIGIEKVQQ